MGEEGFDADLLHGFVFKPQISKDGSISFVDHDLMKESSYVSSKHIALTAEIEQHRGEAVGKIRASKKHGI